MVTQPIVNSDVLPFMFVEVMFLFFSSQEAAGADGECGGETQQ